jgi:hypothetical protein
MQWGILSQTAWYRPYVPPALVIVGTTKDAISWKSIKIQNSDATATLQSCIDSIGAGETLELSAGIYKISRPIKITKPISIITKD